MVDLHGTAMKIAHAFWEAGNGSRKEWKNSESKHKGKFLRHLSVGQSVESGQDTRLHTAAHHALRPFREPHSLIT